MPETRLRKRFEKSGKDPCSTESDSTEGDSTEGDSTEERKPLKYSVSFICIVFCFVICVICVFIFCIESHPSQSDQLKKLNDSLVRISKKFPSQRKDLWNKIWSVLVRVSKPDSSCPAVMLLIDRDEQSKATSKCLLEMVANESAALLPSRKNEPLFLVDSDLCSSCIQNKMSEVKDHGTVVIYNLEKFSAQSAGALHFFADEQDCNFPKAAYFLTITVTDEESHATIAAENAFHLSWASMSEAQRDPLITRLTSQVEFVQPEISLPSGCEL